MMQANSRSQDVTIIDSREALRVKWLTYVNQKKHHENWEEFLVEHGFAREPMSEEERVQVGHVVFREGQAAGNCATTTCTVSTRSTRSRKPPKLLHPDMVALYHLGTALNWTTV
jgi:hypothetical protein